MNDEQSRRLAEAADAIIAASDALEEARVSTDDGTFAKEFERERLAAAQRMAARVEVAARKTEEAVRRATIAGAATAAPGGWPQHIEAVTAVRRAKAAVKSVPDADGSVARRDLGLQAIESLNQALALAAVLVFHADA